MVAGCIRDVLSREHGRQAAVAAESGINRQMLAQYSDPAGIKQCDKLDRILSALELRLEATCIAADAPPVTLLVHPIVVTDEGATLTDYTAIPEVVRQTAVLIDPLRPREMADMLHDNGVKYILSTLAGMTLEQRTGMLRSFIDLIHRTTETIQPAIADSPARRSVRRRGRT